MLSSLTEERSSSAHLEPVGVQSEPAQAETAAQSRPVVHVVKHSVSPHA